VIVSFRTATGHYLCAELDGRVVADRQAAGPWEEWLLQHLGGDTYSLQSNHGKYLCAEPDGRVVADRADVGIWESWRLVQAGTGVAFASHHGQYLCAEGGGGGVVVANRSAVGEWEVFFPSQPIGASGDMPGPDGHPDPLVGQLRVERGAYVDDSGTRLPVFLHLGDLIGHGLVRGVDAILPALDFAAAHGYHGIRSWFQLKITTGTWLPGPTTHGWDPRDDRGRFLEILHAAASRGLKWHLAGGGIKGLSDRDEDELFDLVGDAVGQVGPEAFAVIEACNEVRDTGDGDDRDPRELERLIQRVRGRYPQVLYGLSAFTGHEDRDVLRAWTPDWMPFYLVHGSRDGRIHDKVRHIFSLGYDGEGATVRRLGWQGEPWGPGRVVSTTSHHHEIDAHAMCLGAAMAAVARQAWCVMSGPGVVYGDEPLEAMPGLAEVPVVVRSLPQDLMRFRILGHSGPNQRGKRIHAVREDARDVREDYAIDDSGRFVAVRCGPPDQRHDLPRERTVWDEVIYHQGPRGSVIGGRLS
jgi:hypothetical protein